MTTAKFVIPASFGLNKADVGELPLATRQAIAEMVRTETERSDLGAGFQTFEVDTDADGIVTVRWIFSDDVSQQNADQACVELFGFIVQAATDRLIALTPNMPPKQKALLEKAIGEFNFPKARIH